MSESAEALLKKYEQAESARYNFASTWQEIADHLLGRRDFTTQASPGRKRMSKIYDTTGLQAADMLASALHSFLTNPALRWFNLRFQDDYLDDDEQGRQWLDEVEDSMLAAFNSPDANFASNIHEVYLDQVAFGTAGLYIGDRPGVGPMFSARPLGELHVAENAEGKVDTVYRKFELTARQAQQVFGENAGAKVKEAIEANKLEQKFWFLHCVTRREDGAPNALNAKLLPWASYYVACDDRAVIDEGGYHEMPYMVPRWSKDSGELYGRAPGWNALPEQKMLNEMSKTTLKAAQKAVDPPLLVADDGVVMPLRTQPGGINVVRSGALAADPLRPLPINPRIDISLEMMEQRREMIRGAFHYNLLQLFQDPRMTATQVLQLVQEMQRLMGPMLGRQQSELLEPMIDRVFGILMRSGKLPPHPEHLRGSDLRVEYNSPIAAAQKSSDAQAVEFVWAAAQQMAQTNPEVLDGLDPDEGLKVIGDSRGGPQRIFRPVEERDAIREQRAEQAQAQQGIDQAEQLTSALKSMADGGKASAEAANVG